MSRLSVNLAASLVGRGWTAVLQLVLVPVYLHLLGPESYALVGFYSLLLSVVIRLDMGLSTTLNREIATARGRRQQVGDLRGLVRTLELFYLAIAVIVTVAVAGAAPVMASHWLNASALPNVTVERALMVMGFTLASQWPVALYEGGLRGFEKQVLLNVVNSACVTVRGLGSIAVLVFVSRSLEAFFIWQAAINLINVIALGVAFHRQLGPGEARPGLSELRRIMGFTGGVSGISFLSLALTQADKVVLSKLLPLDRFGYYTAAANLAVGLMVIGTPIFEAIFPRLSVLVTEGDEPRLRSTYHTGVQLSALLVVPVAAVFAVFPAQIALAWTRDTAAVAHLAPLLGWMVVGTAANVVMTVPLALQLAHGWTSLSVYKNVIALLVSVPLLLWSVHRYAEIGAAVTWAAVNVGYLVFELPIMHRRLLPQALASVYRRDIGLPAVAAIAVTLLFARVGAAAVGSPMLTVGIAGVLALVAAGLATPLLPRSLALVRASLPIA